MNQIKQKIINLYQKGNTYQQIVNELHVGIHRVSNTIRSFLSTQKVPDCARRGRLPKVTEGIKEFIEIRTLQDSTLTSRKLANEINDNFHQLITGQYVSQLRQKLKFHYGPPKHQQNFTVDQIEKRKIFVKRCLGNKNGYEKSPFLMSPVLFSEKITNGFGRGKANMWNHQLYQRKNFPNL